MEQPRRKRGKTALTLPCPYCNGRTKSKTKIVAQSKRSGRDIRYRVCQSCGRSSKSIEVYEWEHDETEKPQDAVYVYRGNVLEIDGAIVEKPQKQRRISQHTKEQLRKYADLKCGDNMEECLNCTLPKCKYDVYEKYNIRKEWAYGC